VCSAECRDKSVKKVKVYCACCNKEFAKYPSKIANSKSGLHFCTRACKDKSQKLDGIKEIWPSHYGTSTGQEVCRRFFAKLGIPKCEDCGEDKTYLLSVHHKDGNRYNNSESNFEVLCFNCHVKRHLKNVDGKLIYCTKALTPREILDIV
jgi:hypothetical protein